MNILHIITGDLWAGAEAQVFYCLKEMSKDEKNAYSAILFCRGELSAQLTNIGIKTEVVDESTTSVFIQIKELSRLLLSIKPHIIHVHDYKSHVLTSIAKFLCRIKCKMVRTVHGLTIIPLNIKIAKSYLVFFIEYCLLRYYTQCIIAVSKDIEGLFKRKFPHTLVLQINNAIDFPLKVAQTSSQIRKDFCIPDNAFWIGTAARCVAVKNIQMLIEAAKVLQNSNKDLIFKVSIFGDGQLKSRLSDLIIHYNLQDIVQMNGHSKNILSILKAFDVFVLSSKHEGLPISLLEAMALGTVPVCTNVGGMREIIENGTSGFLVALNNAHEMAQKISFLYNAPDQKKLMSQNAQNRVKEHYSVRQNVQKLLSSYSKIIEE